ncbi:hypothetical protein, partial [Hydrotalea sp.]|uniref:hypothetical protein n=1 Tax=Hydrotalea sp. TaxID=2881279 RepID=UPI002637560B
MILILMSTALFTENIFAQQVNSKYKRELRKFMKFIRNTEFKQYDTLKIHHFLSNKNLFLGMPLFGTGKYGLSNEEKAILIKEMETDTSKYYIKKNLMKNVQFIPDNEKDGWRLSKPIFLRSYLLCAFSFQTPYDPDYGAQWTYLYKKENGKWS